MAKSIVFLSIALLVAGVQASQEVKEAKEAKAFDYDAIEQQLLEGKGKYHEKLQVKLSDLQGQNVSRAFMYQLAERAMYNADRLLELGLVPPVVIALNKEGDSLVYRSFLIDNPADRVHSHAALKDLVEDKKELSRMFIFQFLIGNYDRHFGNLVVQKGTGKLYLIDHAAVAHVKQHVAGYSPDRLISSPWVCIAQNDKFILPNESKEFFDAMTKPQDPDAILKAVEGFGFDTYTLRDIAARDKEGKIIRDAQDNPQGQHLKIWGGCVWRQFYAGQTAVSPLFSATIEKSLLDKLKGLTADDLVKLWPKLTDYYKAPEAHLKQYEAVVSKWVEDTLRRRDMIVAYFEKNPKSVV